MIPLPLLLLLLLQKMSIEEELCDLTLTPTAPLQSNYCNKEARAEAEAEEQTLVEISDLTVEDLLDLARYNEFEVLECVAASEHAGKLLEADEQGNTLLHMSAANGHTQCLELLLRQSQAASRILNAPNAEGNTPLHWAAVNGQVGAVQLLLEAGAELTRENGMKRSAFDEAVAREKFEVTAAIIAFLEKNKPEGGDDDSKAGEDAAI